MISTDITREIAALLAGCVAANGYASNVGASVLPRADSRLGARGPLRLPNPERGSMKAARTLFALLLVAALSGCGAHTSALFQESRPRTWP
jgi:hypothetical protein